MPPPPPSHASGPRVVVIGAGVVGLGCALALARRGMHAVVVDADSNFPGQSPTPRAASLAAAGMLGAFSEVMHEGPGHHRRMAELGAAGLRAWRALAESDAIMGKLARFPGALLLSHDEGDAARVRRAFDRARANDARAEVFEGLPADLDAYLYGGRVRTVARVIDEGYVPPKSALARLAELAVTAGASILRAQRTTQIAVEDGAVRGVLFESGGGFPCDAVVVATGALGEPGLKDVTPALGKLTPAKGLLGSVALPPNLDIPDLIRTPRVYMLKDGERLRFGATSEVGRTDLDEDPDALAQLYLEMRRALPGAKFPAKAEPGGVGLRPLSPDGGPLVGPNGPKGAFVAVGHGRNGWLLALLTGQAIAAYVAGEEPSSIWSAFRPERFG